MLLFVLSPLVGEVLNGATRLSYVFAFVPQLMVWGCGTLVARELARRRGGGRIRVILLGAGLSVAGEFLILQTSVAHLLQERLPRAWRTSRRGDRGFEVCVRIALASSGSRFRRLHTITPPHPMVNAS